ncbi:MAG: hypothetical protein M1305_05140 [Candidatus Marsarchaeota archaeon]|nr:hypothetical protein [Candidatus Marsarchaeota archaeon]
MTRSIYKYSFSRLVPMKVVANSLMLATFAAECLHGRSKLRLEAAFCLDTRARTCVIDAESVVGCDIARMFTGFLTRGFGEQSFQVERAEGRIMSGSGLHASGTL